MPKGWVTGKNQPRWHLSLYTRWRDMWSRCKSTTHPAYKYYKDVDIDESYRYFSNYVNDISKLENFDKLMQEPTKWHIDKDFKESLDRCYTFDNLSIVPKRDNIKERNVRYGHYIIAIPLRDGNIMVFNSIHSTNNKGFQPQNVFRCCKGITKQHKGYKWCYLNIIIL